MMTCRWCCDCYVVISVPTSPGALRIERSTNSLNISWARPLNMSLVSHYYLQYSNNTLITNSKNCSQNYSILTGLSAGVQYSITVRTVGALGYLSSPQNLTAYTSKQCTFVVIHVNTHITQV